jgi:NAD(P)-dependent dehydrogenase (short-subunit alcohol dehydrogenase family)
VVGASTGIGRAIAELLVGHGARVAVSARRAAPLESLVVEHPDQVVALPLDVTEPDGIRLAVEALVERWGGLDLVLCVAGNYVPMRANRMDLEAARKLVDVNLMGVLNVVHAVLPRLLAQGNGGIGIVSSVAGFCGLPQSLVYGPTKAALINLAETLYLDLHRSGVAIHVINPGFVKTPLTDQNDFKMPALISAEAAAVHTLRGLERGEFEIHYPKRFTRLLKLLRLLPYRWYFPLIHRITGL